MAYCYNLSIFSIIIDNRKYIINLHSNAFYIINTDFSNVDTIPLNNIKEIITTVKEEHRQKIEKLLLEYAV